MLFETSIDELTRDKKLRKRDFEWTRLLRYGLISFNMLSDFWFEINKDDIKILITLMKALGLMCELPDKKSERRFLIPSILTNNLSNHISADEYKSLQLNLMYSDEYTISLNCSIHAGFFELLVCDLISQCDNDSTIKSQYVSPDKNFSLNAPCLFTYGTSLYAAVPFDGNILLLIHDSDPSIEYIDYNIIARVLSEPGRSVTSLNIPESLNRTIGRIFESYFPQIKKSAELIRIELTGSSFLKTSSLSISSDDIVSPTVLGVPASDEMDGSKPVLASGNNDSDQISDTEFGIQFVSEEVDKWLEVFKSQSLYFKSTEIARVVAKQLLANGFNCSDDLLSLLADAYRYEKRKTESKIKAWFAYSETSEEVLKALSKISTSTPLNEMAQSSEKRQLSGKHTMISYAWKKNKKLVEKASDELKKKGIDVWRDETGSKILDSLEVLGGDVNEAMSKAIESADNAIIFLSEEYSKSKNCRLELAYIIRNEREGKLRKVFWVIVDKNFRQIGGPVNFALGNDFYYEMWDENRVEHVVSAIFDSVRPKYDDVLQGDLFKFLTYEVKLNDQSASKIAKALVHSNICDKGELERQLLESKSKIEIIMSPEHFERLEYYFESARKKKIAEDEDILQKEREHKEKLLTILQEERERKEQLESTLRKEIADIRNQFETQKASPQCCSIM